MPKRNYNVGLDIGTSSIGWTIVDDEAKIMHVRGKNGYGVRIFSEGQTAADRRGFRTTRRRLKRRKWRLRLLQEIFEPYILPIDENFFMRQKESNLVSQDPNKHFTGSILFNDRTDQEFHEQYPTIYHLRYALMTEHRQFDIREIYWAIHHIVKYRGHFLTGGSTDDFKSGELNLADKFNTLNKLFERLFIEHKFQLNVDHLDKVQSILLDNKQTRSDRQKKALQLIYSAGDDKTLSQKRKNSATNFLKAILGMKTKLNQVLGLAVMDENAWSLSFDSDMLDDSLAEIDDELSDDSREVIEIIRSLHASIVLAGIVPDGKGLSESMVEKYEQHCKQLKHYKKLISQLSTDQAKKLKTAYDQYIEGVGSKPFTAEDDFYPAVRKVIDKLDDPISIEFKRLIELNEFLPKQRAKVNGSIPHQLHQRELDLIIENQSQYYSWLAEENPNISRQGLAKYKLDELVAFRVPYYVGPMIDPQGIDKKQRDNAKFAWMVRRESGVITPWNFDQKVDRKESATRFIKRMTTKDTYLFAEDVLPKRSLLYQKYEVLNELNNIRIDGQKLTARQKKAIYRDEFQQHTSVNKKQFKDWIIQSGEFPGKLEIKGMADETKFLSGLSTENELRKIFGAQIDDINLRPDFEKMVEWATVFEDRKILREKLHEIHWLTEQQRDQLSHKRYRGWGRLSQKLLSGLADENGQRIIDILQDSSENFMTIVSRPEFKLAIDEQNRNFLQKQDVKDVINELYTSPQNKKALRQVMLVVKDIQKAMNGQAPDKIFIEFARGERANKGRTISRKQQIELKFEEINSELIVQAKKELKADPGYDFSSDRVFLYFMQGGKDPYTGKSIIFDDIFNTEDKKNISGAKKYEIDHIVPQSFLKDNSLDNRVLVSREENQKKGDRLPSEGLSNFDKLERIWQMWYQQGLLSKHKLKNLTLSKDKISKYQKEGFVKRQLVETRQIIKTVASLLDDEFRDDETKVITIKADLTHQIRKEFDFPKNRDVNNHHHAFDAYLTVFVGQYLLTQYPKLNSYFVYGEFQKGDFIKDLKNFNLLHYLEHREYDEQKHRNVLQRSEDYATEWYYLDHIYDYKKILVTHEVRENNNALFNRTLYKASDDKVSGQGSKQLIRKKEGKPTELYGGYSSSADAFMSIVRLNKKDETYFKVVGIPIRVASRIKNNDGTINYVKLLDYLIERFTKAKVNKKTGEITKTVDKFELIIPKVYFNQLVLDGGQAFTLGSSAYKYNVQELYLPKNIIRRINHGDKGKNTNRTNISASEVYDTIIDQVNRFFPLFDNSGFRNSLINGKKIFNTLQEKSIYEGNRLVKVGQWDVINKILAGLHANGSTGSLKELKIGTPLGQIQQKSGIILSKKAKIQYQSPTGLFDQIVLLSEIK